MVQGPCYKRIAQSWAQQARMMDTLISVIEGMFVALYNRLSYKRRK